VETVRDLSEIELWQESLQRSLARRGRLPRSSAELARLRPARDLSDEEFMCQYADYWRMRREAAASRPLMPAVGVGGISTLALLAATLSSLLGGRGASARPQRMAYVGHGPRVREPARETSGRAGRPTESRLTVHPGIEPVTASSTLPATPAPRPATHSVKSQPVKVASAKPSTTEVPTNHATAHHAALGARPGVRPAGHSSQPAVAATAARSPRAIRAGHLAAQPHGSGGAGIQRPTKTTVTRHAGAGHAGAGADNAAIASGGAGVSSGRGMTSPSASDGYINPLAQASVTPERIDQGVDYGGTGPLAAIGAGRVTYVGTSNTGWPGAFIEFRLANGPDAGRYVYYAEGIVPAEGLHVGQRISAGQVIATITGGSTGIEIGWGAGIGTESYAMKAGQWKSGMDAGNVATASGKSFSALIASLGGPPGKIEG
jgi:hypothetical protein